MASLMDSALDKYLWEAARAVIKQEDQEWDLDTSTHSSPISFTLEDMEELPHLSMEEEEDGPMVPEVEKEEVVEQECYYQDMEEALKVEDDWDWEQEEQEAKPLLHSDTFIGWSREEREEGLQYLIPWLLWEEPRSVAFVGAEGSRISSDNISNTFDGFHQQHLSSSSHIINHPTTSSSSIEPIFHPIQQQQIWPHHQHFHNESTFNEFLPNFVPSSSSHHLTLFEAPSHGQIQPNDFEELLNISELVPGTSAQFHNSNQPIYEPISAPHSTYSSPSSDSSWNGQDSYTSGSPSDEQHSSSLSQDEILEQIHRECAEIEERQSSASPPQPMPSTSKAKASHVRRQKREPYAKVRSTKAKAQSPQPMDSPMSGEKKKELNRIAATKYREKKRLEKEAASVELRSLEGRNTELRTECSSMEAEIKYLKGLIKEIENRTSGAR